MSLFFGIVELMETRLSSLLSVLYCNKSLFFGIVELMETRRECDSRSWRKRQSLFFGIVELMETINAIAFAFLVGRSRYSSE